MTAQTDAQTEWPSFRDMDAYDLDVSSAFRSFDGDTNPDRRRALRECSGILWTAASFAKQEDCPTLDAFCAMALCREYSRHGIAEILTLFACGGGQLIAKLARTGKLPIL